MHQALTVPTNLKQNTTELLEQTTFDMLLLKKKIF